MSGDIPRRYLTQDEAMEYLRLGRSTMWRHVEHGNLPVLKVGGRRLYDINDLDEWMQQHRTQQEGTTNE